MKLRIRLYLLAIALIFLMSAVAQAESKPLPIPPMYSASTTPTQYDDGFMRQHRFLAVKTNANGYIESQISYSYEGLVQPMDMADQGYEESIASAIRSEEKRLQSNPNYQGRTEYCGGVLFIVKVPAMRDPISGEPGPEKHYGYYYEKLGRGMLTIKVEGVLGGEGRVRDLIHYMRRDTDVCQ